MALQLHEIITPFHELSEEEQLAVVRRVRHNKYVAKPSAKKKKAKPQVKKKKAANKQVTKLLQGLSEAERQALMKQLGVDDDGT